MRVPVAIMTDLRACEPHSFQEGTTMIKKLVHEIADEMSVPLTTINLVDGHRLGIKGSYLLKMTINDTIASTLIHQEKLADPLGELDSDRTRYEIRNAMCRLQILLER
jgi:hypothetical protein